MVIVGGGGHGLAIAYYLATRHGIRDVASPGAYTTLALEAPSRNTTVLRANYKTPNRFRSSRRASTSIGRSRGSSISTSSSRRAGLLWLAHSESALRIQRERALLNQAFDVETVFLEPRAGPRDLPCTRSHRRRTPSDSRRRHTRGLDIRHDAVVWGYAAAAQRLGVHVHQGVDVTGIAVRDGRCIGVETSKARSLAARSSVQSGNTSPTSRLWPE